MKMFYSYQVIILYLCFCSLISRNWFAHSSRPEFLEAKYLHKPQSLDHENLLKISDSVDDISVLNNTLKHILLPRVVGTDSHAKVRSALNWSVELDSFKSETPIGVLPFNNIIATHNPNAKRFLAVACHYDSKYYPEVDFVGATDSAVPCAMMTQIAFSLNSALERSKSHDLSIQFIFFDGEEAFKTWSKFDSLYGARHLAEKWKNTPYPAGGMHVNQLDRIDLLILLDLLGAKSPEFYSFFTNTHKFYSMLANAETKLNNQNLLREYNKRYFLRKSTDAYIEDDHLPFLEYGVPVLHLITIPFPAAWHTPRDNHKIIDLHTTRNLVKILTVFLTEYLHLSI